MNVVSIIGLVIFFILFVLTIKVYFSFHPSKSFNPVRFMSRVGMFGALATLLYVIPVFSVKLPFFPSFLSIHFDEIPAFIAGFAYGPLAGFGVILVKTLIKLPFSETLCVGELTDLILSSIYVCSAALIYKKKRNLKGVAIGFAVSTALQVVSAMLLNVYVMIPFYMQVMGFAEGDLLYVMRLAIPAIQNVRWSYAAFAVLPFNLLKDALVVILTFLLYRSLHVFLRFKKN